MISPPEVVANCVHGSPIEGELWGSHRIAASESRLGTTKRQRVCDKPRWTLENNPMFRFKRFAVDQSHAAMKVGFDGIVLGAWATIHDGCQRVLDVGTGTGLVALMLAQRTELHAEPGLIDAVEIDTGAVVDATKNFRDSPWADRLNLVEGRFQDAFAASSNTYDLIVCNPPYFTDVNSQQGNAPSAVDRESTPRTAREIARQTISLSSQDLLRGASRLLRKSGRLSMIVPAERASEVIQEAEEFGFCTHRRLDVRPTPTKAHHRAVMEFRFGKTTCDRESLTLELSRHVYSSGFRELAREFYLAF